MDWVNFICEYSMYAHWIILGLLLLAGLNVPISEDILLLSAGALIGTCLPEQKWYLYSWIFVGCWVSAWEAYWIGRLLGPKLYTIRWFNRFFNPGRIAQLHHYYEKFGILTFIVGRFIPGGVRNALFITAGMGRMPFLTFIARDFVASFISSLTLFSIGFTFADNYQAIVNGFRTYSLVMIVSIAIIVCTLLAWNWWRKKRMALPESN